MKKKILFITTRNPYSGRYSGDVIRSSKIINLLRKKYLLDVVCLKERKANLQEKNVHCFSYPNFFFKVFIHLFIFNKIKASSIWIVFFKRDEGFY